MESSKLPRRLPLLFLLRMGFLNNNRAVQIRLLSWKTNVHVSLPPPLTFQPRSQDIWVQRAPHGTGDNLA